MPLDSHSYATFDDVFMNYYHIQVFLMIYANLWLTVASCPVALDLALAGWHDFAYVVFDLRLYYYNLFILLMLQLLSLVLVVGCFLNLFRLKLLLLLTCRNSRRKKIVVLAVVVL